MKLTIGEKIALLRKEKNITQTELAKYLFLTPQTVSRWEVGSGAPEITLLPKIATFFGVSIDELGLTSLERTEDLVSKYSGETLNERKKEFMEHPDEISLLRYLSMLDNRQEYEMILSTGETDGPAREIVLPPSEKNLSIWWRLIHAVSEISETDFIEQHLPTVLEICDKKDELDFLMCLLNVYMGEKLAAIKRWLRSLLPDVSLNKYFEEKIKERIEE